jgi:FimV-like protein
MYAMNSFYFAAYNVVTRTLDYFNPHHYAIEDLLILSILVMLLIVWIIPEKATPDTTTQHAEHSELSMATNVHTAELSPTQQDPMDYDFMATHASSPAQFDLVLAYEAMGQKDQALAILDNLQRSQSLAVRERAEKMLDTLKQKWPVR